MGRIAVTPGTVAWQALQRIVEDPGAITCAELAVELAAELGELPPPLPPRASASTEPGARWERLGMRPIFGSFDDMTERRRQRQAHEASVEEHRRRAQRAMARLLSRLQAQGLLKRRSSHISIASSAGDRARARGVDHAIAYARTAAPLFVDRPQPTSAWEGGEVTADGDVLLVEEDAELTDDPIPRRRGRAGEGRSPISPGGECGAHRRGGPPPGAAGGASTRPAVARRAARRDAVRGPAACVRRARRARVDLPALASPAHRGGPAPRPQPRPRWRAWGCRGDSASRNRSPHTSSIMSPKISTISRGLLEQVGTFCVAPGPDVRVQMEKYKLVFPAGEMDHAGMGLCG
jgi:hypothetical protein